MKFFSFEFLVRLASMPVRLIPRHLVPIAVLLLIAPAPPTSPKAPRS